MNRAQLIDLTMKTYRIRRETIYRIASMHGWKAIDHCVNGTCPCNDNVEDCETCSAVYRAIDEEFQLNFQGVD